MNQYDRMSSGFWLLFSGYICVESFRLPLGSFRDPGPGFLPLLVGILLALVLTSACTLRASKPPATQATATSELQFATSTTVSDAVATQTAAVKPAVATATTEPKQAEQPTTAPTKAAEVAQPAASCAAASRRCTRTAGRGA